MKRFFFIIVMVISVIPSFGQFADYKSTTYPPVRTDIFSSGDRHLEEIEREHRRAVEGAKVVQSNTVKSKALCIDSEQVYDVQIQMKIRAKGTIEINVIGIKTSNDWVSCSATVNELSKLLESYPSSDMENRGVVLSLMEIASLYFIYNNKFYVTGSPE